MRKRIVLFAATGVFLAVIFASNGETSEKKLALPEKKLTT